MRGGEIDRQQSPARPYDAALAAYNADPKGEGLLAALNEARSALAAADTRYTGGLYVMGANALHAPVFKRCNGHPQKGGCGLRIKKIMHFRSPLAPAGLRGLRWKTS